ncbi:MAG: hypothetical protein KC931_25555 [Candidatus Omnitrophica bacterium]|nr:hypothetical protein [Candidatus Omnitrophota bacterium]
MKRILGSIVSSVLVIALLGLLTGGLTYGVNQWFGGQEDTQLEDRTPVYVWLRPTQRQWDVPLLAHYRGSLPPYTLQIWIPAPDPTWTSAVIDEVTVDYEGGTNTKRQDDAVVWQRADGGMSLRGGPLKDLVTLHEACTITVKGHVLTETGEARSFSFSHHFIEEPVNSGFAAYWWVLAQEG